jgi:hypothetical protein
VVLAYGLALSATGAAALVRGFSGGEPVSGFMLGPVLALAGVALLAVAGVKRLGREQLTFDGVGWQHSFALGRRAFGARTIHGPRPVWRLRLEGARGALLELVGEDGTLVLGAGATSRSDQSVTQLLAVPGAFREASDRPRGET